jgi:eukaryotic-like serine/threonine-protein kinase
MDGRAATTPTPGPDLRILRFGMFELDLRTGELRKGGLLVKLQQQPFKVLSLLAGQAGELVTRDDLRREVWGGDTYVDFDQGLNFCIKQIRSALGDQADAPRYIETLPRRGYRFIAPIEAVAVEPPPEPAPARSDNGAKPTPLPFPGPSLQRRPAVERLGLRTPAGQRLALVLLAVTAVGALAFVMGRSSARAAAPAFQRLTFRRGLVESARFAADGGVLFAASWDGEGRALYSTRHGAPDTRMVDEKGAHLAGVSATEVATVRKEAETRPWVLSRQPLSGGPRRNIADGILAADWSRDGNTFAVVRDTGTATRLELPLGTPLATPLAGSIMSLRLSPRGDRVAFLEHPMPGDDRGSVVTVDARGARRVLSAGWASLEGLAWSPDGSEVWFTGTRLGADLALNAVTLDGSERVVYRGPGRLVLHDIEPGGRVLLSRNALRIEVRAQADDEGERDLSWFDLPWLADLTADGQGMLFGESGDAGGPGYGIFLRRGDEPPVRLGEGRPLTLSPDGLWVGSLPLATPDELVLIPTGIGEARRVPLPGLQYVDALGWLPDSSTVVVSARQGQGAGARLFAVPLAGGPPRPVTPERVSARRIVISPDGQWVVAGPADSMLALFPLAGGAPKPIPGVDKDDRPLQWSQDGSTLFVARGRLPVEVWRIDLATGQRERWRELAPDDRAGVEAMQRVVVSRDGHHVAFGYGRGLSELYLVSGLK